MKLGHLKGIICTQTTELEALYGSNSDQKSLTAVNERVWLMKPKLSGRGRCSHNRSYQCITWSTSQILHVDCCRLCMFERSSQGLQFTTICFSSTNAATVITVFSVRVAVLEMISVWWIVHYIHINFRGLKPLFNSFIYLIFLHNYRLLLHLFSPP